MDSKVVTQLANLSMLSLTEEEVAELGREFDAILGYVAELNGLLAEATHSEAPSLRNVLREDADAHTPGVHTEALLEEVPERDGSYVRVKKIL